MLEKPLLTFSCFNSGSFVIERILHYITEVELCLIDFNSFASILLTGYNCYELATYFHISAFLRLTDNQCKYVLP